MKRYLILFIGLSILFVSACRIRLPDESELPSWTVDLEIPIAQEVITARDLLTDSLISPIAYENGVDSIFAYEDEIEIETVEVGNQLNIEDVEQTFSQSIEDVKVSGTNTHYTSKFDEVGVDQVTQSIYSEIGKIELDDTEPTSTAPILLTEIVDLSGVEEGETMTIIQGTPFPTIYREVTFTEFDQADFTNGILEISIQNDLVLELGAPITIRLLDADSVTIYGTDNDSAKAEWSNEIPPDGSASESIYLQGKSLPGTVLVGIDGVVCGSGDEQITNNESNRNSSFVVRVQARDLQVTAAQALVPEQTIDTTGVIALAESDHKVQRSRIQNGSLRINIANHLPVDAILALEVPSIDISEADGVQAFSQQIDFAADQTVDQVYPLSGYFLVMDIDSQEVDYNYVITTEDTDPDKVQIDEDDDVTVEIDLYGANPGDQVTFSRFTGIVNQDPILESGEIDVTTDSKIINAHISTGTMTITVRNNINMDVYAIPQLNITIPEILDESNNPIMEIRDLYPEPNTTTIVIDLAGYRLHPNTVPVSADSFTQHISYTTTVAIPAGIVARYDLTGDFDVEIDVSELTFSTVEGYFEQDAIVERDAVELEEDTKIEEALISEGELVLDVVNNIGAVAVVTFKVKEMIDKDTGNPLQYELQLSENPEPISRRISLAPYKIKMNLPDDDENQQIHYVSTISIPSDEPMTLELDRKINVDMDIQNLSFAEVQGYIDTVSVDIDTVEQEISALPDELEGINLNNVEMQIHFDTNIEVPVYLDLTLISSNQHGDRKEVNVYQNIVDDPLVNIPDASALINIKPDQIVSYGSAAVGGNGTVAVDQYVQGVMKIVVPMDMEITDDAMVDMDPELVDEDLPEVIESVILFAETDNQFDFGGFIEVLAARDTNIFNASDPEKPDTLATFRLFPDSSFIESIMLEETKFELLQDSLYLKTVVNLLGKRDEYGQPESSQLLPSDSLSLLLYGSIKGLIDLSASKDKE